MNYSDILKQLRNLWALTRYNDVVGVGHETSWTPDFTKKENQFVVTCDERIEQLRLTAKMMTIADYYNRENNWRPEFGETAYYLDLNLDIIIGDTSRDINFVAFKKLEYAELCKQILSIS